MNKEKNLNINDVNELKDKIYNLYKSDLEIHLNIDVRRMNLNNVKARITGVYNKFFGVESLVNNYMERFTITYIDVLTKKIVIKELY